MDEKLLEKPEGKERSKRSMIAKYTKGSWKEKITNKY